MSNPIKPWDWHRISQNPDITLEVVMSHPDKPWNWLFMSKNPRMLVTKAEEVRIGKTRLLVTRLQRRWRACVSDPSHPVCRRRLNRELSDMIRGDNSI